MENNYLILNPTSVPAEKEQELAILFLDIRNFAGLMESQPEETVIGVVRLQGISQEREARSAGKPYSRQQDFDYLLAISG